MVTVISSADRLAHLPSRRPRPPRLGDLTGAADSQTQEATLKSPTASKRTGRPVLVTTEYRGVFFGYATDTSGDTVTLTNARNCIYWSAATGGFMGLASNGPAKGSRVGETVTVIELRKVTAVAEMTPKAVEAWTEAKTYVG